MSVINATPLLAAAGGDYQISRSVRLRSSASAFFNRTPASAGNRKTWTWSGWVKRGLLSTDMTLASARQDDSNRLSIKFISSNVVWIESVIGGAAASTTSSVPVYRDPSAWYHLVLLVDTTNATAALRLRIFVNGIEATTSGSYPSLNSDLFFNGAFAHALGRQEYSTPQSYFDGYLTEINFIDGQALTPSSFGETDSITGVWKPKKYAGTYGTNGFYLNFSDNSAATAAAIGKDYSGNGNNWTPNNISVTAGVTYDSMLDVPTLYADGGNGRGNYAVMNPLHQSGTATPSFGNLRVTQATNNAQVASTFAMTTGKWYYEHTITAVGGEQSVGIGVAPVSGWIVGGTTGQYGYYSNGNKYIQGTASAYGASYTTGDVIGVAYDADAGSLTFYKNGTSQGVATTGLSGTFFALAATRTAGGTNISDFNFGQRPFAYTPPTGFKALNTQNLPEPTIKKGNQYFDATTYTGNLTGQSVTNAGSFQPDLVWVKSRSAATDNKLTDAVRGATLALVSNSTAAETTDVTGLTAFNSNGFTVGASTTYNNMSATYVGWQWKESPSAGFDIVTYTGDAVNGRTISHSLGVAPRMIVFKRRNGADNWPIYHASIGATNTMFLDLTNASATSAVFNNTSPTSSVFTVSNFANVNASGGTYVAYLFAEVAGFSKAFSYTGNGSSDGPFIFCGFRPRWVMIKRTDSTGDWFVFDTARNTFNTMSSFLRPNWSDAEATNTNHSIDLLSNGFKSRAVDTGVNASGGTYIGFAFAESPFRNSLAR